jgi:N-acetylmuramoyl-L-alanine amidase
MRIHPTRLDRYLAPLAAAAVTTALAMMAAAPAAAQTPAAAFERAQAQERDALAETPHAPETLRKVARSYEAIALRYPVSGYSDNALWQAAGLLERVFTLSGVARDRDEATRYLAWLQREYPHSPLVRQAAARVSALTAAAAAPPPSRPAAPTGAPIAAPPADSATPAASSGRLVAVRSITQTALPRGDRITIELTGEAPYSGERVANPDRIFFDFANAASASALAERIRSIRSPLIKTVRVGAPVTGVARVVVELIGSPRFSSFALYEPFRLVVDVETDVEPKPAGSPASATPTVTTPTITTPPVTTPPVAAPHGLAPPVITPASNSSTVAPPTVPGNTPQSPPPSAPSSTRRGDYSLSRQLGLRVARVVIDPGHGGHDPGAQANGVTEAELVLDVALRLEKLLLQQPGVEVVLTRRTGEFVPLEERTAIANREKADLFLSIHANAHRQSGVRGVETYFLNFAMNEEAEAVAARENATSVQTMGTLPAIVKAITLNDKLVESREFAGLLQTALVRRLRAQSSGLRDHGVKTAPFVVLIGAQMPSVLTEIAFLTNRSEAGLLKQTAYRQHIAQALKDAVVRYQESLKRVTTVATKERER